MSRYRRSSDEWFNAWDEIINREDKLTRNKLSELSGAGVQTIKSLQTDWMAGNNVKWDGRYFRKYIYIYLSSLTPTEQEKFK